MLSFHSKPPLPGGPAGMGLTGTGGSDPRRLRHDLRIVATFIQLYCDDRHADLARSDMVMKSFDVTAVCGRGLHLCDDCRRLLAHAWVKRSRCPLNPKPACRRCPQHCYAPVYRERIREVMRHSGMRLFRAGRLHYLWHLFF